MPAEILSLFPIHEPVRLLAPAKVNLFLDVLERRSDGYHNLDAVNVSVDLFDEIEIILDDTGVYRLECETVGIPLDEENHLVRAAQAILSGTRWGVSMRLKKRIPVGAGLGGGTSDAAALIRYLARAFNLKHKTLMAKALEVGSDVPYCVIGGPSRVRGRGELVQRLSGLQPLRLVLLDPGTSHQTGPIYGRLPPATRRGHPPADLFIETWRRGDWKLLGMQMFNAFQDLVFEQEPRLRELREELLERGCLGACLTGTGSHLVGLMAPDQPPTTEWNWDIPGTRVQTVRTLERDFAGWFKRL